MKMKSLGIVSLLLTAAVHAQLAENYPDATGEIATPGSGPHIDIDSVDVALDETEENLTFTINLVGDPIVTNWGKYMIGIRTGPGGATSGNAWGRPINFSTGITHWIGAWADGDPAVGGVNLSAFAAGSWSEIKASYSEVEPLALPEITETSIAVTIPTALIGYVPGQSFAFDVYTSGGGGGDGAVDALSASETSISNWNDSFTTSEPLIFGSIDPTADDDGDGYTNEEENSGTSALGYQSDPLIPNYTEMNVAGSFNDWSTLDGAMTQGDTASLVEQYQWSYDLLFETAAQSVEYKFTTGGSFDTQWGQGNGAGAVVSNGGNISGFVGASGAYRIFFDQGKSSQSFGRLEFDSLEAYLAAYGLEGDPTGDADGDSLTNEEEFAANTDPLNLDTDDDGASDDIDLLPLVQTRDIEFSVNMSVQEAKGLFTAGSTVQVQFFSGTQEPLSTLTLSDPDEDLIYTATLSAVQGFEGQTFGTYKFITDDPNAPNGGYEFGFDRSFNLGVAETPQTLDVVFFSGDDQFPQTGFAAWAAENAGGGTLDGDFDGDGVPNGVEYLFGETGSSTTLNPGPVDGVVGWPRNPDATDVGFRVWSSDSLAAGSWVDVTADADTSDPTAILYTLNGSTRQFIRLEVFELAPPL